MAWQAEKSSECPGCGLPLDETTKLDHNGNHAFLWEATSTQCGACAARDRRQHDGSGGDGIIWSVGR